MTTIRFRRAALAAAFMLCLPVAALAQFNPTSGDWGKDDTDHLRVMTWNVSDAISTAASKTEGLNAWCGAARIVAGMKPDILILQEAGDNGSGVDSKANLETVCDLFLHGGFDVFGGGTVTSYVQKYDAAFDLPHVFVSDSHDGFNRNVILSRYPFSDLNGDGKSEISDMAFALGDLYSPGGNGGIRGFQHAEIDLPGATYAGDLVIGNSHLKSGGDTSDIDDRRRAAQNIAYYIDAIYNGLGTGTPDPNSKIIDSPPAVNVLDADSIVITGGDWNEDEASNGQKGPAEWITQADVSDALSGTDGTDKDRTDMTYDSAADPFTGNTDTLGSSKLDYLAWQDSASSIENSWIFNSATVTSGNQPAELIGFPVNPSLASATVSNHKPVLADFSMGAGTPGSPADVVINEVDADQTGTDVEEFIEIFSPGGAVSLEDHFVVLYNGNGDVEYRTFDLDGQSVPADGFFVIGPQTGTVPNTDLAPGNFPDDNAVQNGADAVAIFFDPTGSLQDSDFFGTAPGSPPGSVTLIDAVVYDTSDSDDAVLIAALTPGQAQIDENGNGAKDTESNSRVPDGGTALVTTSYVQQAPTPGTSNGGSPDPWTDLGCALAGVSGDPLLVGTGPLTPGSLNALDLSNAAPTALSTIFVSLFETPTAFKGGTLKTIPILFQLPLFTDGTGAISLPFNWPAAGANPFTFYLQFAISDAAAVQGVSMSNALRADAP